MPSVFNLLVGLGLAFVVRGGKVRDAKPQAADAAPPHAAKPDVFLNEKLESGYIPVGKDGGEMFFIWTPYKGQPSNSTTPFAMWLTGGPGCSSEMALFTENGPLRLSTEGELSVNPHSWSYAADMVYVDQPLGTGFSVAGDWMNYVTDEDGVAEIFREFLVKFLDRYPFFKNRPFFITGESYAGHYIPSIAELLLRRPIKGLDLQGIALGNAWVDPKHQFKTSPSFAFENGMISEDEYETAKKSFEICNKLLDDPKWPRNWPVALVECTLAASSLLHGRNLYDIREPCKIHPLCYNMTSVDAFLNLPEVQNRLGVEKPWESCSQMIRVFMMGDWMLGFQNKVSFVLNKGLPVLVYSGDKDFICNWKGGLLWTSKAVWKGALGYSANRMEDWKVDGIPAGSVKSYGNLSFLRVKDAGHMVPMDRPKQALAMLKEFLQTKTIKGAGGYVEWIA